MSASSSSLLERWFERVGFAQRLRRAVLVFFMPLLVAAIIPTAITILFNVANVVQLPNPVAKPVHELPKAIPEPTSDDISRAWNAVRGSSDIVSLVDFAVQFPDSSFADDAWARINELVKAEGLQVASLDSNAGFIATVLEHKDKTSSLIEQIVTKYNLESKYPLGFAIFYADGQKILNYVAQRQGGAISFDASLLRLTFSDNKSVCISTMPVRINGQPMTNFSDICFGGNGSIIHALKLGDLAAIDIQPLGQSQQGLAWVIGMRPL